MTIQEVDKKLETLRQQWEANPEKRGTIELQARPLQWAKDLLLKKQKKQEELEITSAGWRHD